MGRSTNRSRFPVTTTVRVLATGLLGLALSIGVCDRNAGKLETLLASATRRSHDQPFLLGERTFACRYHGAAGRVTEIRRLRVLGITTAPDHAVPLVDRCVRPELFARLRQSAAPVVILSEELARSLWAGTDATGQTLAILRPGEAPLRLEVLGTFASGCADIAHNLLITSLATAQTLLDAEGE